jgi:hypothetical protein
MIEAKEDKARHGNTLLTHAPPHPMLTITIALHVRTSCSHLVEMRRC